jgi:hypothetical protein
MDEAIKKIAGADFSVVDLGMSQYPVKMYQAPYEYAVVVSFVHPSISP